MIIRTQPTEELVLVPQSEHSKLVGQLAAHWGNQNFETPRPFASVTRGATCHDFGWIPYETDPLFDEDTGETPHYLFVPNSPRQLQAYQHAYEWLSAIDSYSGLLVSMHRTGLWQRRYGVIDHPKAYLQPANWQASPLGPEVKTFIASHEAAQELERKKHNEDEVWTNYRMLQVWDLLGLYFSCHDPDQLQITPVPAEYTKSRTDGVRLTMKPGARNEVIFDPFPFRERGCKISLVTKRLPRRKYQNSESFKAAYYQAQSEILTFTLS